MTSRPLRESEVHELRLCRPLADELVMRLHRVPGLPTLVGDQIRRAMQRVLDALPESRSPASEAARGSAAERVAAPLAGRKPASLPDGGPPSPGQMDAPGASSADTRHRDGAPTAPAGGNDSTATAPPVPIPPNSAAAPSGRRLPPESAHDGL